jgi:hypothetical protein
MPVIVASGRGNVVTVNRSLNVATVTRDTRATAITDRNIAASVRDTQRTVAVAAPGPQGTPGAPGGTSAPRIADGVLGGHRIVRSTGANSVGYASSDNPLHGDDTQGMTLGAAVDGGTVNVQRVGPVTFNGWSWSQGEPVFLGVDGLPTQTAPTSGFIQVIGHAEAPDTLYLQIEPPIYFED